MVKKKKLYSFIIGIFAFIIAFNGLTVIKVVKADTTFPEGSTIGGINVGEKTEEEATSLLLTEVNSWKSKNDFTLTTSAGSVILPHENIKIDVKSSVEKLKKQVKKPWYLFFTKSEPAKQPLVVHVQLTDDILDQLGDSIDVKKTIQLINNTVAYLGNHEIVAVPKESNEQEISIAETAWEIPSDYIFLDEIIEKLNGQTFSANSTFSYMEAIANKVNYYGEAEGNFVASMLYSLLLQTNVEFIERHSQGTIPSYSQPGIEAKVSIEDKQDLKFFNPGPYDLKVSVEQSGNLLKMNLLSKKSETTYRYSIENSVDVDYRTITRYNKDLQPGHHQVLQQGSKGKRVEVYRISYSENGERIDKELISKDFYLPISEILLVSPSEKTGVETNGQEIVDDEDGVEEIGTEEASSIASQNRDTTGQTTDTISDRTNQSTNAGNQAATTEDSIYEQPDIVK